VSLPITTTTPPIHRAAVAGNGLASTATFTTPVDLPALDYSLHTATAGDYYTLDGSQELMIASGRPVQPKLSVDVHQPGSVAQGVVMVGGTFTEVTGFDPVIARLFTQEFTPTEPAFPLDIAYPAHLAALNRLSLINGELHEQLVVVPAQFQVTSASGVTPSVGLERLYTDLHFEVYHASADAPDQTAPFIWQVQAITTTQYLRFCVAVEDDAGADTGSGTVARVLVLYHQDGETTWHKAELTYHPEGRYADIFLPPPSAGIVYFVQAVDPTGNVAVGLDHGKPFTQVDVLTLYTLHVTRLGYNIGVVRSAPPGIDCGSLCAADFVAGTRVTLTAETESGSLLLGVPFAGWGGACTGTGMCVVTMTAPIYVTATFVAPFNVYLPLVLRDFPGPQ
jgi:hypothetical protein